MATDTFPRARRPSAWVLRPGDDGYDEARLSFNGMVDRRPAVIVHADDNRRRRGGRARRSCGRICRWPSAAAGTAWPANAIAEGALVVDLRRMRAVTVDPERRRARAGGGALWEDVDGATVPHSTLRHRAGRSWTRGSPG